MKRSFLIIGSGSMVVAIILGAFGAHGLKELIPPERITSFEVGVRYQIYHALALLLFATLHNEAIQRPLMWAARLNILGTIFFSVSIYLLACRDILGLKNMAGFLGPITPIGGLMLISSWLLLFVAFLKKDR